MALAGHLQDRLMPLADAPSESLIAPVAWAGCVINTTLDHLDALEHMLPVVVVNRATMQARELNAFDRGRDAGRLGVGYRSPATPGPKKRHLRSV
jgi:hypothetical protein